MTVWTYNYPGNKCLHFISNSLVSRVLQKRLFGPKNIFCPPLHKTILLTTTPSMPDGFLWTLWIPMDLMDPYGSRWILMDPDGSRWNPMDPFGSLWIPMDPDWSRWIPMDPDGSLRISMDSFGSQRWISCIQRHREAHSPAAACPVP